MILECIERKHLSLAGSFTICPVDIQLALRCERWMVGGGNRETDCQCHPTRTDSCQSMLSHCHQHAESLSPTCWVTVTNMLSHCHLHCVEKWERRWGKLVKVWKVYITQGWSQVSENAVPVNCQLLTRGSFACTRVIFCPSLWSSGPTTLVRPLSLLG